MPTIVQTRERDIAPTSTTSFAREICWTCANRVLHNHRPPIIVATKIHSTIASTPQRHNNAREHPPDMPETDYRSPNRDPNSARCIIISLPKCPRRPPSEASQQPHRQAAIHRSPSCSRLRDAAPKKEKDAIAPLSFNSEDLRFPSGARPRDRGEEHSAALPRKSMAPAGVTVAGSCCYYCCLIQHVHFWIRIICSYWCRIYFHLN
jgi:hypothetical protein